MRQHARLCAYLVGRVPVLLNLVVIGSGIRMLLTAGPRGMARKSRQAGTFDAGTES